MDGQRGGASGRIAAGVAEPQVVAIADVVLTVRCLLEPGHIDARGGLEHARRDGNGVPNIGSLVGAVSQHVFVAQQLPGSLAYHLDPVTLGIGAVGAEGAADACSRVAGFARPIVGKLPDRLRVVWLGPQREAARALAALQFVEVEPGGKRLPRLRGRNIGRARVVVVGAGRW
jgi:hypothetical protein